VSRALRWQKPSEERATRDRLSFDLQVDRWENQRLYVCVIMKIPHSRACFSGAPQVTRECETLEEFDEEISRAIAELEEIRALGREALAKSSNRPNAPVRGMP
jgi:hypothetical protein